MNRCEQACAHPRVSILLDRTGRHLLYFVVALKRWEFTHPSGEARVIEGIRIGPSVYNNNDDIDHLLEALG